MIRGAIILHKLLPPDFIIVNSCAALILPNAIKVENKTPIGTANTTIQAKLKRITCTIIPLSKPLPSNLSRLFIKNCKRNKNKTVNVPKRKGPICNRNKYLARIIGTILFNLKINKVSRLHQLSP